MKRRFEPWVRLANLQKAHRHAGTEGRKRCNGGFVWQIRSAAEKQTFSGGASAVEDDGCDFRGRKNRARTMPFWCPFRASFVPRSRCGRGLGCLGGRLTRDAVRAVRKLALANGKKAFAPMS